MNQFLNVVGVQLDIVWEDKEANFQKIRDILSRLDSKPDLIVFPETFATGFTMRSLDFAEAQLGPTEKFLIEMAKKTGSVVGGSWMEENKDGMPFNTFSIARPSGIITNRYHKIHPFSFAEEDKFFTAGEKTETFELNGFHISLLICYDLRFPEVFRKTAGSTDLYLVIGNWPEARIDHWLSLLKARAIENLSYVLGVNRVGYAGRKNQLYHTGHTAMFDPFGVGEILESKKEEILKYRISSRVLKEFREKYPFLKDRRKSLF
ncbi:MAG TPA: nitrilase-related carbon-nitrogen hydrolase [Leptospiraceae bacterium]|nr:nitrilase-related carbon-nitrogen hydrolase [Leptospiraceae bacterium]HMW07049.1 nitrilase-related carbon-nitrogen hydrolase [Leptospiraceae bacterium]HMX32754.1 nitrilase-related carbon-nitrogen hydrolase [Leptospiraceae bacterium]HMY33854.1 nitrilase-related carbon-nitrogen hydrolase [Leptospiraceae bacterium]HMZ66808.1 nitrilase-related carbon-nitrogen hydrolase [Leptospiraceae bacterium]